jgi:predicted RNA-binding protein YlxR (DUF448 family)
MTQVLGRTRLRLGPRARLAAVTERAQPRRTTPMRTCIGCRVRSAKSDLLRIVAVGAALVPDPRGRLPGRGAHLHPTPDCLALAERRRAFGRALRLTSALDVTPVREWVSQHTPVP